MANIKNMQMWNSICADARISISKTLFGLRTTATFSPTNSVIDANTFEYSPADGERLKRILDTPRELMEQREQSRAGSDSAESRQKSSNAQKLSAAIGDFRPKATVNGNYMAEVCASRDGAFLAVQLHQFTRMSYEPVTDVLLFEGDDARMMKQLF